ncbi:zinc finger protein Rts2p [[Candida] jaroonii]|uniref:Zinc finger protein Rts2p n=1 Tax=[Candida] jaroonii TaxID=467808 RepID=A0ACA9YA74_9ASCO|nr:zinc finger protein Rts2p [[Candida] jaroonii]
MGKSEIGTAKYYSKQLKSSGLKKTKFYCQICEKQCNDLNGFRNHQSSPSHTKRVAKIVENNENNSIINEFSEEMEKNFLSLLKMNHGTKWIEANKFYQEYILIKDHIHLNSTRWLSLTGFVKYLSKSGKIKVEILEDENFKMMIKYNDGKTQVEKKEQVDDGMDKFIQRQVQLGKQEEKLKELEPETQELSREEDPQPPKSGTNDKPTMKPIRLTIKKKVIKPVVYDSD